MQIIKGIRENLGGKIEIPYWLVSGRLPERPEYWFNKSALEGISVPIGMEGAGKIVNLEFGHPYHSFSAMIGGVVGSGKSVLLHTIITGVLLNYSPEDVQIYLLDFKQGVEFKLYADVNLSNFRVISVDTEPEFGFAVLKELHDEMGRRSAKFRSTGVSRIEEYWRYRGERGETHADMPRLLIIFDEVQALLSDTDSGIAKLCASYIKDLVTMSSRAFGMHLILSTQTYENVRGLDNGTYSNMHTRIALNSSRESVNVLLDSDNEITDRLSSMDPGQGVFNNNAGDRNANRTYRGAIIEKEELKRWLEEISARQREVMGEEPQRPRILLSGPEDDFENPLTVFASTGQTQEIIADVNYHLYIGESLTMVNTYLPVLMNDHGSNLLIAGREMENVGLARMIIGYSVLSILYETIRIRGEITRPLFTVFDLRGNALFGNTDLDMFTYIQDKLPSVFRLITENQILNGIQMLYEELQEADDNYQNFVIFYGLNRAKELTAGTYERSPKEVLEQMFADGPKKGMNFIVWANDPGLLIEDYSMAMSSFYNRLAYGMEDSEYKTITRENGPKQSSEMNAISFNLRGDNQKVRMYQQPTNNWLDGFLENVLRYVKIDER